MWARAMPSPSAKSDIRMREPGRIVERCDPLEARRTLDHHRVALTA
jgi:hypothetical protein